MRSIFNGFINILKQGFAAAGFVITPEIADLLMLGLMTDSGSFTHSDVTAHTFSVAAQLRAADWLKFDMGQVYVMIAFSIFPVILVYLFLSKHIVQGVALGSVKG